MSQQPAHYFADAPPVRSLRYRAQVANELLMGLRGRGYRPSTREEVEAAITALENLGSRLDLCELWRCTRCHAEPLTPCVLPDGSELRHRYREARAYHLPRLDRASAAVGSITPDAWRDRLANGGPDAVRRVAREIRRSTLGKSLLWRLPRTGRI